MLAFYQNKYKREVYTQYKCGWHITWNVIYKTTRSINTKYYTTWTWWGEVVVITNLKMISK